MRNVVLFSLGFMALLILGKGCDGQKVNVQAPPHGVMQVDSARLMELEAAAAELYRRDSAAIAAQAEMERLAAEKAAKKRKKELRDKKEKEMRNMVVAGNERYMHVRESKYWNGKSWVYTNRGKEVEEIQHRAGCTYACAWCGAYVYCVFQDQGIDARRDFKVGNPTAVRSWFGKPEKIVYRAAQGNKRVGLTPQKGDVVSTFSSHIEIYVGNDWWSDVARKRIPCVSGNTGGDNGEGQGVHLAMRPLGSVKLVANYLTGYYANYN